MPTRFTATAILASLALTIAASARGADQPADPGDVEFQKFLLQQHYGPVLTSGENNQQFIDAKINGQPVHLQIDSGAEFTVLSRYCAERLGLAVHDTGDVNSGVGGKALGSAGVAPIKSFTINNWEINRLGNIRVLSAHARTAGIDGFFGFDCLHLNSAIMIVGGAGILIRPGLLTEPPSVEKFMRRSGFSPVSLRVSNNRLLLSGSLNGYPLRAIVDCGAAYSYFNLRFLRKFDIYTQYRGGTIAGIDGRPMNLEQFTPDSLTLGTYQARRELFLAGQSPTLEADDIQALIGFDFLSTHRGVLDTGSAVLWLK